MLYLIASTATLIFILIIPDLIELTDYTTIYRNLIYTILKTAFYILYPIFVVYFIDFVRMHGSSRDTTENIAWMLFYGGMIALIFAKYIALKYFKFKSPIWLLLIELFYAPFLLFIILLCLL